MNVIDSTRPLVTVRAVAARFGVTDATVLRWVREHRIPAVQVSRKTIRFDLQAVEVALTCRPAEGGAS